MKTNADYSEYLHKFDCSRDAFGECSDAEHEAIAAALEQQAAEMFPGIEIIRDFETKTTGPDEDECYEITEAIGRLFEKVIREI